MTPQDNIKTFSNLKQTPYILGKFSTATGGNVSKVNLVSISPDDPEEKFYEMGDDEIAENTGNFAAKVLPLANGIAQIFHVSDNLLGNLIYLGGETMPCGFTIRSNLT